jgi:hypothetical protein
MEIIRNTVTIQNIKKYYKINVNELEKDSIKHIIELGEDEYKILLSIKSNDLSSYSEKDDLIIIKKLSEYYFGFIPVSHQKHLLKEYTQKLLENPSLETPLKLQKEDFENKSYPSVYLEFLNGRIYSDFYL